MDYYIVNLSHTRRDQKYITVWRPDCKGYAWPLEWAGRYAEDEVRRRIDYYNDGCANVAVRCHVLEYMAVPPQPGEIDNNAGPVVPNNAANWQRILANTIELPRYPSEPQYRGAPRKRKTYNAKLTGRASEACEGPR